MKCDRCGEKIPAGEEMDHYGQILCEDCYMQALSPAKACDPWAVHSAKSFMKQSGTAPDLTGIQTRIIEILRETGGVEPGILVERLDVKPTDLEREIATLRHMEKVRGELKQGKRIIRLW